MLNRKRVLSQLGGALAPRLVSLAPGVTSGFVRHALHRALVGVGPLPPAASAAERQLLEQGGDVEKAVSEVIENHVAYAGAGGFVTNVGGLVTMAVSVPANVTGLALVQCRMVAGIAHLYGYDVDDPRVRNAVLACLLGEERVEKLVRSDTLPAGPRGLATAGATDADLDHTVAGEVAAELLGRVTGKRLVTAVSRRVPVVGGVVGASSDGYATYRIGRYAARELRPRTRR